MSEYDTEAQGGDGGDGGQRQGNNNFSMSGSADTRYIRSLEGIVKIIALPLCILGFIVTAVGLIGFGGWYIFCGFGFIFYVAVVLVVETFIPKYFVHRLIDAVVMGIYALLFGLTAIANFAVGIAGRNPAVGVATIFSVACCGLCVAGTVFAIMTYRKNNGQGWAPSEPFFGPKGNTGEGSSSPPS